MVAEKKAYFMIYNANGQEVLWQLPDFCKKSSVKVLMDSSEILETDVEISTLQNFEVSAWSVVVLEVKKAGK